MEPHDLTHAGTRRTPTDAEISQLSQLLSEAAKQPHRAAGNRDFAAILAPFDRTS